MMAPAVLFTCNICGEGSKDICVLCTKDVCANHRCERCKRCSDCCECDVPLSAEEPIAAAETVAPVETPVPPAATDAAPPATAESAPPAPAPVEPGEPVDAQTAATGDIPPYLPESFESPREPGE
jgi:hypothetical protein